MIKRASRQHSQNGEDGLIQEIFNHLQMGLSGADPNPSNLWIDGPSFTEYLHITASGEIPFRKSFTLPPGRHAITFRSDGKKLDAPMDRRSIVFRVHNFRVFWMEPGNDPPSYSPGSR